MSWNGAEGEKKKKKMLERITAKKLNWLGNLTDVVNSAAANMILLEELDFRIALNTASTSSKGAFFSL